MGKGADLEIKSHYYEGEADYMRSIFKNNNKDVLEKELLSFVTKNYGRSSVKAPVTIVDDSLKNEFVLLEQYRLDSIWKKSVENPNYINLAIIPSNLTSALAMPTQLNRTTPYALTFPMVRKHNFEVILPEKIRARPESYTINSDFFYYDYNSNFDVSTSTLNLSYYYKNQSDHVPPSEFDTFYDEMVQLDSNVGYLISTSKSGGLSSSSLNYNLSNILLFALGGFSLFVAYRWWCYITHSKKLSKEL